MSVKKYRCSGNDFKLLEVVKETKTLITYVNDNGRESREGKDTQWVQWFDKFEDMQIWALGKKQKEIADIEKIIEYKNNQLNEIKKWTK